MATLKKKTMLFDMNTSNNKDIIAIFNAIKEQRAINKKILKYKKNFANTLEKKLISLISKKEVKIHKFLNFIHKEKTELTVIKLVCLHLLHTTMSREIYVVNNKFKKIGFIEIDSSSVALEFKVLKKLKIITSTENKDIRKTESKDFCKKISFFWKDEIEMFYREDNNGFMGMGDDFAVFKFSLLKPIEYKIH